MLFSVFKYILKKKTFNQEWAKNKDSSDMQIFLHDFSNPGSVVGLTDVKWMCILQARLELVIHVPHFVKSGCTFIELQTANLIPTSCLIAIMMSKGIQVLPRIFISERAFLRQEGPVSPVITCRATCAHARRQWRENRNDPESLLKSVDLLGWKHSAWESLTMGSVFNFFREKVNSQQEK